MTESQPDRTAAVSPQRYARLAGLLYLVVIVNGAIAELVVRQRLFVPNDAAATAANILAHERLFRWGFAADVFGLLCVMPLIMLLYELLKIVNPRLALLALFFSLVGSAIQAAALLAHFAPLILLTRGALLGVDQELRRAGVYIALQLQAIGYSVALAFFGGTMITRGYLILRSTFLPRIIGVALMIEGVGYMANSCVDFVAPELASTALALLMVTALAEVALCLWLLIRGVNAARWHQQRAQLAGSVL